MKLIGLILLLSIGFNASGQKSANVDYNFLKLSRYHVIDENMNKLYGSSFKEGDFSIPLKNENRFKLFKKKLCVNLEIDTTNLSENNEHLIVNVINNSDSTVTIPVIDNCLIMIAEIYYVNQWLPIECMSLPTCGNSYFNLQLTNNSFWKLSTSILKGSNKLKIRYKLKVLEHFIYSNSVWIDMDITELNKAIQNYSKTKVTNAEDFVDFFN